MILRTSLNLVYERGSGGSRFDSEAPIMNEKLSKLTLFLLYKTRS